LPALFLQVVVLCTMYILLLFFAPFPSVVVVAGCLGCFIFSLDICSFCG